jgi:hypothetical protein
MQAMTSIAESDASPSVTRISDSNETRFYFATKKREGVIARSKSAVSKLYLQNIKSFDLTAMCLLFIGYEGSNQHVDRQKLIVDEIVSRHGRMCVGTGPGELYDQQKFDTPYLRDFLLDRGALADVSETSAPWAHLEPLYKGTVRRANEAFDRIGVKGYIMCHLAHSYHAGARLYFTFAFRPHRAATHSSSTTSSRQEFSRHLSTSAALYRITRRLCRTRTVAITGHFICRYRHDSNSLHWNGSRAKFQSWQDCLDGCGSHNA